MSRPRLNRMDALLALSIVSAFLLCPLIASAQTTQPAATMQGTYSGTTTITGATVISGTSSVGAPATAPAPTVTPEAPVATQPFVGTVTADKVYVRSGPGPAYYELGHVAKGDTVQVLGNRSGWYQILPPNGTYCMVAKEFIETDAAGETGTVKADYVNVRAGTALNKTREPSAVLAVIRKGTRLTILGSNDKYYEVAPPEKAYVYISPQFVKAAPAGTEYRVPDLKLPPGTVGPSKVTVTAPTTLPPATVEVTPTPTVTANEPPVAAETRPAPVAAPTPVYTADAYKYFDELNKRYQDELLKPVGHRDLDGLIKDYKDLLAGKGGTAIPPSVKQGSEARIADLEKLAAIQRLQKESAASADATEAQRKALHEQYASAEKALEEYERSGPYLAEGNLQTSTAVQGKYALVYPSTGRTVAYVDSKSAIDIGSLLGKYSGVRGTTKKAEGTDITVIQVKNATLLPAPAVPKSDTR